MPKEAVERAIVREFLRVEAIPCYLHDDHYKTLAVESHELEP